MVRFGIVGFGLHAVKRLMPGFREAGHATVTALSRRSLSAAQASAREHGVAWAFTSARELGRCPEVDAVVVATPNACHLADVLAVLESRKPVLVEKPMALNADEARRMVEASRRAGVFLGVAQVFRFAPVVERIREHVRAGLLGRPVLARCDYSYPGRGHARSWIADAQIAGGGPIMDVGVHCFDALRFVLEDEVTSVRATAVRDAASGGVEASATVALEFSKGTVASVSVSARAHYHTFLEVIGEEGVLSAAEALNLSRPVSIELARGGIVSQREELSNQGAFPRQIDAFALAVEGSSDFRVPAEEGWKNQLIIDAAYRSLGSPAGKIS